MAEAHSQQPGETREEYRARRRAEYQASKGESVEVIEGEESPGLFGNIRRRFSQDKTPKQPRATKAPAPKGHPSHDEIGELVALANLPVAMLSPRDALTEREAKRLTDSLDTYAQTSETARRWMYGLVRRSAILALASVGVELALPRLIRHGILPPTLAPYIDQMVDPTQLADAIGMTQNQDGSWSFSANGVGPDYSRPADVPPMESAIA